MGMDEVDRFHALEEELGDDAWDLLKEYTPDRPGDDSIRRTDLREVNQELEMRL